MTRDEILTKLLRIMSEEFEVENPGLDDDLRENHSFDSIDAITLLELIEEMIDSQLSQEGTETIAPHRKGKTKGGERKAQRGQRIMLVFSGLS